MEVVKTQLQRLKDKLSEVDLSPPDRAAIYEKVESLVQPLVNGTNKNVDSVKRLLDKLGDYTSSSLMPLLRRSSPEGEEPVKAIIGTIIENIEDELVVEDKGGSRLSRSMDGIKRLLQRLKDLLWGMNLSFPDRAAIWGKILSLVKPLIDGTNGSARAMKKAISGLIDYTGVLTLLLSGSNSRTETGEVTDVVLNIAGEIANELEHAFPKKGKRYNGDEAFNALCLRPFHEQGAAFLNVYWEELGDQAEYIFEAAYETFRMADMHVKGISLIHQYEEGGTLDEMAAIYFYEKLCKLTLKDEEGKKWRSDPHYSKSMPEMMSEMKRRQKLKRIDVNYDGKLSFIEYLLDQYSEVADPEDFIRRNRPYIEASPGMEKAKDKLADIHRKIRLHEDEKKNLEIAVGTAKEGGNLIETRVAEHNLSKFLNRPKANDLLVALISAEAAVRRMKKIAIDRSYQDKAGQHVVPNGNIFWGGKVGVGRED